MSVLLQLHAILLNINCCVFNLEKLSSLHPTSVSVGHEGFSMHFFNKLAFSSTATMINSASVCLPVCVAVAMTCLLSMLNMPMPISL